LRSDCAQATVAKMTIVMIPSASGGIGHISRTAALARALRRLDPAMQIEYLLDANQLRPFNVDVVLRMGFRPRLLPSLTRQNRDAFVRACLGDADVIVDDAAQHLLPLRRVVQQAAWISVLMHPVGDELFGNWPYMAQMDALIWPYAPLIGLPRELEPFEGKLLRTGPFLETEGVPDRRTARRRLGLSPDGPSVLYAPRGFPFGREFGHSVLSVVYRAVEALRGSAVPGLQLVLIAVAEPDELRGVPGLPATLPDWMRVEGVVPPSEALLYTRAADVLLAEGTSTMHEGAALGTPLVLVPGPIQEALVLAQALGERGAADVFGVEAVMADEFAGAFPPLTAEALAGAFAAALAGGKAQRARIERAHTLVTGSGGVDAAARLVLDVAERRRADAAR
jgi:hypothetical protein